MTSSEAYFFCKKIIKGRSEELEKIIMENPWYSYFYALDVIKGRFYEAEKCIMKNPESAYLYARYIIEGRWPEAEEYIKIGSDFSWREYRKIFNVFD